MPQQQPSGTPMRTCTECGESKELSGFTSIKGTPYFHGRCKACRAARARGDKPPRPPKKQPMAGMRVCARCSGTKPLEDFLPVHGTMYRRVCFVCRGVTRAPVTPPPPHRVFERACTDCGETKPIDAYVRIKSTPNGFYGGCRDCRAKRYRERYHANPAVRANEIRRAQRNRARRRERPGPSASEGESPTTPASDVSSGWTYPDPVSKPDAQPSRRRWCMCAFRQVSRSVRVSVLRSNAPAVSSTPELTGGQYATSTLTSWRATETGAPSIRQC